MAKKKHRVYTKEFKLNAIRMVLAEGLGQREVAARLGVSRCSLQTWIRKFRVSGELPPVDTPQSEAETLKQLRDENARLRMENEILKKATAYFARDHL